MPAAFVLGNGRSRLAVNLTLLREWGPIYGCNALYREFEPDVLISTDRPISTRIQDEGYALNHRMYTRKPIPGRGALRVPQEYYGFSSGPIAVGLAAMDQCQRIYLLGFDLGPLSNDRFNNVYADTEFYKKSSSRPTYTGNWIKQIKGIMQQFATTEFCRVLGDTTAGIADFDKHHNYKTLAMSEFLDRINNKKDI
jgi:hypothetical protein